MAEAGIATTNQKVPRYEPFMTTMDRANIYPGDDEVPGMVIHPDAKAEALLAIALSRASNIDGLLSTMTHHGGDVLREFAETIRPQVQEVLILLEEGTAKLQARRETSGG